jgi:4a-hydroxytetrahydrobiopterin dehydratase
MRVPKLADDKIQQQLGTLTGWQIENNALTKTYTFAGFAQSLDFVNRVGAAAEVADHHPDINIRFGKVTLVLSTHDSGGITEKDFALAAEADRLAVS